jgi:hypothetical protein
MKEDCVRCLDMRDGSRLHTTRCIWYVKVTR